MQTFKMKQSSCNAQLQKLATVNYVPAPPALILFALVTKLIKYFQPDNFFKTDTY